MSRKNVIIIILIIIVIIGSLFLIFNTSKKDNYFIEIPLTNNNQVTNNNFPKYIDTILSVGLDAAGLNGVHVVVLNMSQNAQQSLPDYELKAHVREWNGTFYLFLGSFSKNESIRVLSHEIIHIHQYFSEELKYSDGKVYWQGEEYDLNSTSYDKRPWEENAFDREGPLSNAIETILY